MRAPVVVALITGLASPAHAFVRTLHDTLPVFWRESCVSVTIYLNGFDQPQNKNHDVVKFDLSMDGIVKSVTAAAHAWSIDSVICADGQGPSLEVVPTLAALTAAPPPTAYDARNSIVFRTEHWGMSGRSGLPWDYDAAGLAVTTVTSSNGDGHILDVDMEINATNPNRVWMNLEPGVTPPFQRGEVSEFFDLQNALTHEFGHLVGLGHTCFRPQSDKVRLRDDHGDLIPDCGPDALEVPASVMYPQTPALETSKRTLFPDDILAVCTIYPSSRLAATCSLDDPPPGCSVAPPARSTRGAAVPGAVAVAALATVARRRRRVSGRRRARA